jgi:hypothetical protein
MRFVHYASAMGSLMYAILCFRPNICFVVSMVNRYQLLINEILSISQIVISASIP